MVERMVRIHEVRGSIPLISTTAARVCSGGISIILTSR